MPTLTQRGYTTITDTIYGITHIKYDPAKREITYPGSLASFKQRNFSKIVNKTTGATIVEFGNPTASATLATNADGTIKLNFISNTDAGSSTDIIETTYVVPQISLSRAVVAEMERSEQNKQSDSLQAISSASVSSMGGHGFKLITDAMGTIVGNFSSVFVLQSGTRLSSLCTTELGSDSNLSLYTFEAGAVVPAPWTAIRLDTGAVMAYHKK